jgi:hypothetical protein
MDSIAVTSLEAEAGETRKDSLLGPVRREGDKRKQKVWSLMKVYLQSSEIISKAMPTSLPSIDGISRLTKIWQI